MAIDQDPGDRRLTRGRGRPFSGLAEVFFTALRLGLTSFGGPVAHLGYFREEYVARRKWLDERSFADLIALSQMLPGPASSQLGIAIGTLRAGPLGGFAAWLGFTMPSAIVLILFGYGVAAIDDVEGSAWLHGLSVVVVPVVALAVWSMARSLCPDRPRAGFAIAAAVAMLFAPGVVWQVAVIAGGGVYGWAFLRHETARPSGVSFRISRNAAVLSLAMFFALLIGLSVAAGVTTDPATGIFASFYRTGSLVFGGGHVVLPLLETEIVGPGWVRQDEFAAGYAVAQAVPGPLFTFSAYLGTAIDFMPQSQRWLGGLLALAAMFLPSFLLVWGVLPFWGRLRSNAPFRNAMLGVNAAVVGLLLAALYDPIWTGAVRSSEDFALALGLFGLLAVLKWPPWLVVIAAAAGGIAIEAI